MDESKDAASKCEDDSTRLSSIKHSDRIRQVSISGLNTWERYLESPTTSVFVRDARSTGLSSDSVDVIMTSPPYWQKRDYGHSDQIGQEPTPDGFVSSIMDCLTEWKRVLRPTGSIFLNVGDTYSKRSLVGIPGRIEAAAVDSGWLWW